MNTADDPWRVLRARLARSRRALFLLDFDGTISHLVDQPHRARLSPGMRETLSRLAAVPGWHVAILSGRRLADVHRRVGVSGLTYAGNHGAEIDGPRVTRQPVLRQERRAVLDAARRLSVAVEGIEGATVEPKGLGVVVHHRRVRPGDLSELRRRVRRIWRDLKTPLGWADGHRIWEMRPGGLWGKGQAALHLWRAEGRPIVVAVGDDRTDEDMFRALPASAITVRVGRRRRTAARYTLRNPGEVETLLRRVASLRTKEAS